MHLWNLDLPDVKGKGSLACPCSGSSFMTPEAGDKIWLRHGYGAFFRLLRKICKFN
jgi:hypothetical protein